MRVQRLFSFEWALILKSINVARTAADPYSFPIDCTFSIWEEFGIEFIKMNKRERVYLAFSASSITSRCFTYIYTYIYICNASCFELKNLYIYSACLIAAVTTYAAVIMPEQFSLNEKSAVLHLYSLLVKSKEHTKASKLDMFHVRNKDDDH